MSRVFRIMSRVFTITFRVSKLITARGTTLCSLWLYYTSHALWRGLLTLDGAARAAPPSSKLESILLARCRSL